MQASAAQRAVAAARSTASTFDLPVDATVVLNDSNRLVVRLMLDADVVARVTPPVGSGTRDCQGELGQAGRRIKRGWRRKLKL